jgi:hypothetical protein
VAVQPRGREVERKQDGKAPSRVAPATRRLEAFFRLRFAQPIWQPRLQSTLDIRMPLPRPQPRRITRYPYNVSELGTHTQVGDEIETGIHGVLRKK